MGVEPSMFDVKYKGLSTEEAMRQAERDKLLYAQKEAQRESNELVRQQIQEQNQLAKQQQQMEQERLQAEKENADKIARATIQAETDRFNNEIALEKMRQLHEEKMRCMQLCDNVGVDYEEINLFINFLSKGDNESINKSKELDDIIKYKENALIDYRNHKPNKDSILNSYNNKISALKKQISNVKMKKNSANVLLPVNSLAICGSALLASASFELVMFLAIGLIIFNVIWILGVCLPKSISKRKHLKQLEEELKKINTEKDNKLKEYKAKEPEILLDYNKKISNCQKDLDEAKKEKEELEKQNKQLLADKGNNFIEFRIMHYNEEMEMLLNKLNFEYLKVIDKAFELQNHMTIEECAKENGTVKEYIQYMRKAIK